MNIARDERTDRAVRQVLRRYADRALANVEGARLGADPECLHDLRVAVRRTRSGLGEMRRAFPRAELEPLRVELAWLGSATGPARDADVLIEALPGYAQQLPDQQRSALAPLLDALHALRASRQGQLTEALDSVRCAALFERWMRFLDADGGAAKHAARAVERSASRRISRRWKRTRAGLRALDDRTPVEALHELRIAGKKLRYLLEMFRPVFGRDELTPLIGMMKALQDVLGDLNDCAVQGAAIADMAQALADADRLPPSAQQATTQLLQLIDQRGLARRADLTDQSRALGAPEVHARFNDLFEV